MHDDHTFSRARRRSRLQRGKRAREEAKRAPAEIRNLGRSIQPAILTDRGLDAAVSTLGAAPTTP